MNYLRAVMEAVTNQVGSINQQQLTDAKSTELSLGVEQNEYQYWTNQVDIAKQNVDWKAGDVRDNPNDKGKAALLTDAQTQFQNVMTQQQTYTQQADGGTQAMQNKVGQDSTNGQMAVGLETAMNAMSDALGRALGVQY